MLQLPSHIVVGSSMHDESHPPIACWGQVSGLQVLSCQPSLLAAHCSQWPDNESSQSNASALHHCGCLGMNFAFAIAAATLVAQYNNLDSVREIFEANKGDIAGIILEPVVGNSGYIEPTQEFLQVLSQLIRHSGRHHTVVQSPRCCSNRLISKPV